MDAWRALVAWLGGAKPVLGHSRVHVPYFYRFRLKIPYFDFILRAGPPERLRDSETGILVPPLHLQTNTRPEKHKYLFNPGPITPQTLQVVGEAHSQPPNIRLPSMWQRFCCAGKYFFLLLIFVIKG